MGHFMVQKEPHHLQVLRIVDCKIDSRATHMLLCLLSQKSMLRTLALVNVCFDGRNEKQLVSFLSRNSSLKELDLSWNQMRQKTYIGVLQSVVENSNLLTLNLSHNQLIVDPKTFATEEGQLFKQEKMAKYLRRAGEERRMARSLRKNSKARSDISRGSGSARRK